MHRAVIDRRRLLLLDRSSPACASSISCRRAAGKSSRAWAPRDSLRLAADFHRHHRLHDQIVELQRLDQIGVPDQRAIGDLYVGAFAPDGVDLRRRPRPEPRRCDRPRNATASCAASCRATRRSKFRHWRCGSRRDATTRRSALVRGQFRLRFAGLDQFRRAKARGAAEHDEIDQRIGAEPIGAMHGNASRLANAPSDPGTTASAFAAFLASALRRDNSSVCRPYCNARSA